MKRRMRKASLFFCAVALLLALVACGNEGLEQESELTGSTATRTEASTDANKKPEGETTSPQDENATTGSTGEDEETSTSVQTDVADINDLTDGWTPGWH